MTATLWLLLGLLGAALVVLLSAWALVALNQPDDAWQTEPEPVCPPCTGDCNQGRTCPARYRLQPVVTHDADGLAVTEWHALPEGKA